MYTFIALVAGWYLLAALFFRFGHRVPGVRTWHRCILGHEDTILAIDVFLTWAISPAVLVVFLAPFAGLACRGVIRGAEFIGRLLVPSSRCEGAASNGANTISEGSV